MKQILEKLTANRFLGVLDVDATVLNEINHTEENIDMMNKEISQFISKILMRDHANANVAAIEEYSFLRNADRF